MQAKHLILLGTAILSSTAGCSHRIARVPTAATSSPTDNSYMDLAPGGRLRILIPLLNSAPDRVTFDPEQKDEKTIVLSAANLAGYEVSYYSIQGRSDGKVRLRFTSAEITKDGKTVQQASAPTLAFPLPLTTQHIRLIYLVRKSRSDHNMVIIASKNLEALNVFTNRLKANPDVCRRNGEVFCSWVPAGTAVRPE